MNPSFGVLDHENLAYVIGVALGDGNLSNPNGRATRLRITCDTKYPILIQTITAAVQKLLPENKVGIQRSQGNYVNVSCYSNKWEQLLGWKVGDGPKHVQRIHVPDWIKENQKCTIACLRGLFQTDGSIYNDRGYLMVIFVTVIPDLAKDVMQMIESLGFQAHCYFIKQQRPILDRYNIRLSKHTGKFINAIALVKH